MLNCIHKAKWGFVLTLLLACQLSGCGGKQQIASLENPRDIPNYDRDSLDLAAALIELDNLPTPQGVSPELFAELKQTLRSLLISTGESKWASTPASGLVNQVDDLTSSITQENLDGIQWTYKNTGDYDHNSEVNPADLTPIALNYGKTPESPDWQTTAQFADGDGNGEVNLADITPIAINFLHSVNSWRITGADSEEGPFTAVEEITWDAGTPLDPSGLMLYNHAPIVSYPFYRVTPIDSSGAEGQESLTSQGVILTDNTVVLGLEGGLQFVDRLEPNIIILEAPSSDPVDLEVGDILLSDDRAGILFAVDSFTQNGTEITVEGHPAMLEEALVQGAISFNIDPSAPAEAKSVSEINLFEIDISGVEINTGEGLDLLITDGSVTFVPVFDIRINYNSSHGVDFMRTTIGSASFSTQYTAQITAQDIVLPHPYGWPDNRYKTELFSLPFTVHEVINGMPVGALFTYKFSIMFNTEGGTEANPMDGVYAASVDAQFPDLLLGSYYGYAQTPEERWTDFKELNAVYGNVGIPAVVADDPTATNTNFRVWIVPEFSVSFY